MKTMLKRWALGVALLAMPFVLASCGSQTEGDMEGGASGGAAGKPTLKIGYLPITHAAPLYIEDELAKREPERFKNFNLELVKFGSWPDLIDAVNAGQVDGASVLVELAMQARGQGIPIKAVALGHREGNVIVAAPDIKTAADFKGKTFAIPNKFSTHNILLYQMLKQAKIPYEDVNVVDLAPAEMPAALAQGRIAGYSVAEPFGANAVVLKKGKTLFQSGDLWKGSICCVLVLQEKLIKDKPAMIQEFIEGYAEAGKRAETKDEKVRNIMRRYMKVDDEVLNLSLEWISYEDLKLDQQSYGELKDYLAEMKLSKNLPSYEEFVDPTLLDRVK